MKAVPDGDHGGVADPVVDHSVHADRHRIPGEDLQRHALTKGVS
jgi:hypothetical protein